MYDQHAEDARERSQVRIELFPGLEQNFDFVNFIVIFELFVAKMDHRAITARSLIDSNKFPFRSFQFKPKIEDEFCAFFGRYLFTFSLSQLK